MTDSLDYKLIGDIENLRDYITRQNPEFVALCECSGDAPAPADLTPQKIQEHYLALSLRQDPDSSASRREMRDILNDLQAEYTPLVPATRASPVPVSAPRELSSAKRKKLWEGCLGISSLFQSSAFLEQLRERPAAVAKQIEEMKSGLSRSRVFLFLHSIGAEIIRPNRNSHRFLSRVGWIARPFNDPDCIYEMQYFAEKVLRMNGISVRIFDRMIALFSGSDGKARSGQAVCIGRPACDECVLNRVCRYHNSPEYSRERISALPIKSWNSDDRPRESLAKRGPDALSDPELLAIIIKTGAGRNTTAVDLARNLLMKFGSLRSLECASLPELQEIRGIGPAKAVEIKAALELGKRFASQRVPENDAIGNSGDIFRRYRYRFTSIQQETFYVFILNAKNQIIHEREISRGSLSSCLVHPREVFKEAIRYSAHGVIFMHNHPSGDPTPSRADISLTTRLKQAGELLEIRVIDHIIIGETSYYSFADEGLL
ncbi:MAG TPA: DNA repair protein RadC [Candidatus Sumerlaeota bacterium]|nr:DNA repair protein RadC [Candidatus Sumerlaeota bacterium]